jgi:hypothetical protein
MPKARHGCNSESKRRSRRVADIKNGQNKEQAKKERTQGRRGAPAPHGGRKLKAGNNPNSVRYGRVAPQLGGRHKSWLTERQREHREQQPAGGAQPTRRGNGHAKRHWGRDCQCTWRHLIRKPAKLTGARHELCTWGEPTRPGVSSPSRTRHTQCVEHNRKGHCGNKVKTGRIPIMEEVL